MPAALEIRGLTKSFPGFTLGPIDLTVPEGAIYGFVGPNGAGKTTTIDLIFGMGAKNAGAITVLGLDHLRDEVAMKQQVGYVSPDLTYSPWGKVGRVIRFVKGFYPTWDDSYCEQLLRSLNVGRHERILSLSFGARIKLSLILALSWRPKLLILDEPTVGLDAISKQEVFGELLKAVGDGERSVLISSHGLTDLERFADHIGMIKHGRMLFEGSTADMIERHRIVDFVADHGHGIAEREGVFVQTHEANRWRVLIDVKAAPLEWLRESGATRISETPVTLEELFVVIGREQAMVARLVLDVVWRKRYMIGVATGQLYLASTMILDKFPATDPMAPMLMAAWFLTIPAGPMLQSRELYQLPVSRRTWWLARWWLSVAGAVVIPVLVVFLAQWSARSIRPGAGEIGLYAVWAFLYGACAMALTRTRWGRWGDKPVMFQPLATPIPRDQIKPVAIKWMIGRALLRVLPGYFAVLTIPLAAPFFVARYLPHTFGAIDARSVVVMLAMAAVSVWGYLYRPANEARPSQRMPQASPPAAVPVSSSPAPTAGTTPARVSDRLTGLQLVLWEMSRKYFTTYSSVFVIGMAWWWVTSWYKAVPALAVVLGRADMLPFGSRVAHATEPITVGALCIIASFLDNWIMFNIRPLRALPISTNWLSSMPILIGLVSTVMLWTTFLLLHLIVLRTMPVSLRLDLFTAYAALTAVSQTIRMTLPGNHVVKSMVSLAPVMIAFLAPGFTDTFRADIVQPAMLIGGVIALATSFAHTRDVVTRSSRLYRPQLPPVRFGS